MKRWIKHGIWALTLSALLTASALAAELSLSFDKQGTTANVLLKDVGTDRCAAEVTLPVSSTHSVQFRGKADSYALTVDSAAGTVTLYAASSKPLAMSGGALQLGTLTVATGTEVSGSGTAIVLDPSLNRFTYADMAITVTRGDTSGTPGSDSSDSNSSDRTPSVSVNGAGGKVKASSDGSVTITPDTGYRIARILVNGKQVAATDRLTGLKASDVVVVTFEKIPTETDTQTSFTDVRPTDWFADAVQYVVSKNLFQGMSATEFRPQVQMNRAMLVTVLHRMSGETAPGGSVFADVAADSWYGPAVSWAQQNGIVQGVSSTSFAPDNTITREQMATILYRYAKRQGTVQQGSASALASFADAGTVSPYAISSMRWAVQQGLLSGTGSQTLSPGGFATRAQVATILQRFLTTI